VHFVGLHWLLKFVFIFVGCVPYLDSHQLECVYRNKMQPGVVAYPAILLGREGGSTNSVEDRGQRERGSGSGSPIVRDSAQFANE
jgi:hypothetical protein